MSGNLVAEDSTSEELPYVGDIASKDYNMNTGHKKRNIQKRELT